MDEEVETAPELPELPVQPATVQHPALSGDAAGAQAEVEHRSPEPAVQPATYSRTFEVGRAGIAVDDPMHAANAAETLGDAIRRGLHPKDDVRLTQAVEHVSPRSTWTRLTYTVPVVPAVVDHDNASTLTPRDVLEAGA